MRSVVALRRAAWIAAADQLIADEEQRLQASPPRVEADAFPATKPESTEAAP